MVFTSSLQLQVSMGLEQMVSTLMTSYSVIMTHFRSHVIQGSVDTPSVKFVSEVFAKCIRYVVMCVWCVMCASLRLACYDVFVEMVPPEMTSLLPPEPAPLYKYRQDDGETALSFPTAKDTDCSVYWIRDLASLVHELMEVVGCTCIGCRPCPIMLAEINRQPWSIEHNASLIGHTRSTKQLI